MANETLVTVCVPSYNRSEYLKELLESVNAQTEEAFELLICEDQSPEREQIHTILTEFRIRDGIRLKVKWNHINLGYDGNIRNCIAEASGRYCLFLGNDDILAKNAVQRISDVVRNNDGLGIVLRDYAWFKDDFRLPVNIVRYGKTDAIFSGRAALKLGVRRAGVISGFVAHTESANAVSTDIYDGTLYYQIYLACAILRHSKLYYIHDVLTYSRMDVPPDFGDSVAERDTYTPGAYTAQARYKMLTGVYDIVTGTLEPKQADVVLQDYANHFYVYLRDQLELKPIAYLKLIVALARYGYGRHIGFYANSLIPYLLGVRNTDALVDWFRRSK